MKTKKIKKKSDKIETAGVSDGLRSFENIGGPHFEPGEKAPYEKGSVVTTDKDLVKLHPGKFQEVFHSSVHPGIEASKKRAKLKKVVTTKVPAGKNVTKEFTDASGRYQVWQDGAYYSLINTKGKVLASHKDATKIQDALNERNAPKDDEPEAE